MCVKIVRTIHNNFIHLYITHYVVYKSIYFESTFTNNRLLIAPILPSSGKDGNYQIVENEIIKYCLVSFLIVTRVLVPTN